MIEKSDYNHARAYLGDKLLRADNDLPPQARRAFFASERLEDLNKWCEKYLTPEDWKRLRAAIRKRRSRFAGDNTRGVTISARAHKLLSELAERDGVTYSDVLEDVLQRALNSSRKIKPKRD